MTKQQKQRVVELENLAHVVVDSPAYGHFHEKPFVERNFLGRPYVRKDWPESGYLEERESAGKGVRILHAPSDPRIKGSGEIRQCIERLTAKGFDIDYVEISGLSNEEVVKEILRCDFVVDQVYSDLAMSGFAAEAALFGKPAIVCGYLEDNPWKKIIPTLYCHPRELQSQMMKLIEDPELRLDWARKAGRFFQESWSCEAVCGRYLRLFLGDIPDEWWVPPDSITYVKGCGLNEDLLSQTVKSLVETFDASALQLDDKPRLRDRFLRMAGVVA